MYVHALLSRLAIRADSLVLILQKTQHLIEGEGWVRIDTCVVSCRQFETHVLSVSSLGIPCIMLGVRIHVKWIYLIKVILWHCILRIDESKGKKTVSLTKKRQGLFVILLTLQWHSICDYSHSMLIHQLIFTDGDIFWRWWLFYFTFVS